MAKEIMTLEEGRDALRISGDDNDDIIKPMLAAIPDYLKVSTGNDWAQEDAEDVDEMAKTAAKFLLQLWFFPQDETSPRIKRTLDNLLTAMTIKGRGEDE